METDATTPNIVRPAKLGVNAAVFINRDVGSCCSVCTYYKSSVKPSKPIWGVGEGDYLRGRAYLMVSVLHKELEYKVETLKFKTF